MNLLRLDRDQVHGFVVGDGSGCGDHVALGKTGQLVCSRCPNGPGFVDQFHDSFGCVGEPAFAERAIVRMIRIAARVIFVGQFAEHEGGGVWFEGLELTRVDFADQSDFVGSFRFLVRELFFDFGQRQRVGRSFAEDHRRIGVR